MTSLPVADRAVSHRRAQESTLSDLLARALGGESVSARAGHARIPTGFGVLDQALGGALHVGDLLVLGGLPGSGKTIATLQWARNMAEAGNAVLYLCYEHDAASLLGRLLALEIGSIEARPDAEMAAAVAAAVAYTTDGAGDPDSRVLEHPLVGAATLRMHTYADRLVLAEAGADHDLNHIVARVAAGAFDVVVVDYLQKIPSTTDARGLDRSTEVVEGLKDLALDAECLVVAISAVNAATLSRKRLTIDGLRDAHVLAHEADVVITLNNKIDVVSRSHLAFDTTLHDRFSGQVVFSIEKNRRGMAPLHVEFDKHFAQFRFDQRGRFVAEKLVDDVLVTE
jgi:replicative DNA helicase